MRDWGRGGKVPANNEGPRNTSPGSYLASHVNYRFSYFSPPAFALSLPSEQIKGAGLVTTSVAKHALFQLTGKQALTEAT